MHQNGMLGRVSMLSGSRESQQEEGEMQRIARKEGEERDPREGNGKRGSTRRLGSTRQAKEVGNITT